MAFRFVIALLVLPRTSHASDAWDDFANNLATDLAPILQLFGEQVTKQFLSESTSILDNIIFAMAPLGILTAVVSVIRVCGNPVLRAFVGRAQEGAGVAEAELCSSTGRDVCEMYQNGAITRVFGRPKILEFVHDAHDENFYEPEPETESTSAGIYTFPEYNRTKRGQDEWVEDGRDQPSTGSTAVGDDVIPQPLSDEYAPNPNLMLNIGFRKPPRSVLIAVALFGVFLQSSVIAFAIIATRHLRLTKGDTLPPAWALPSMVIGTTLLCLGMFMCAFLIERSTIERTFSRRNLQGIKPHSIRSTVHWIQPGGQVVGDQSFDSFAYNDAGRPLPHYISSWRKSISQRDSQITWITILITIIGFIVQFVGLRGVHSTVSVYQLCAILIMSMLRALLRTQRLDGNLNRLSSWSSIDINRGHELDWLAFDLAHQIKGSGRGKPTRTTSDGADESDAVEVPLWRLLQVFSTSDGLRPETTSRPENDKEIDEAESEEDPAPYIHASCGDSHRDTAWIARSEAGASAAKEKLTPNLAARVWHYRVRLCRMTTPLLSRLSPQQAWPSELVQGRSMVLALTRAISESATLLLPHATSDVPLSERSTLYLGFQCGLSNVDPRLERSVPISKDPKSETASEDTYELQSPDYLYFSLKKESKNEDETAKWIADSAQLEAAIALQTWSLATQFTASVQVKEKRETVKQRRILAATRSGTLATIAKQLRLWTDLHLLEPREAILDIKSADMKQNGVPSPASPAILWIESSGGGLYTPLRYKVLLKSPRRFFGWNAVPVSVSFSNKGPLTVLSSPVRGSLARMCAQDIFTGFLVALFSSCDRPLGDSTFAKFAHGYGIKNETVRTLVDIFVQSGLGSKRDAVMCVVPSIFASSCKSHVQDTIDAVYKSTLDHVVHGRIEQAENELTWVISILEASSDEDRVRKLFFPLAGAYMSLVEKARKIADFQGQFQARCDVSRRATSRMNSMILHCMESKYSSDTIELIRGIKRRLMDVLLLECPAPTLLSSLATDDPIGAILCRYTYDAALDDLDSGGRDLVSHLVTRRGEIWRYLTQEIFENHTYVRTPDESGRDALSWACSDGEEEAVEQLLRAGALLTHRDNQNWTPFHHAIAHNREDILSVVLPNLERNIRDFMDTEFWDIAASPDVSWNSTIELVRECARTFAKPEEKAMLNDDEEDTSKVGIGLPDEDHTSSIDRKLSEQVAVPAVMDEEPGKEDVPTITADVLGEEHHSDESASFRSL